ncbi:insulinase family protein [Actinoplanes sp. TRM 88003]|uniref:Insulinase family protein n=1 Tax=Paractinoplanes aksuensis TaxID=2939490 RepID=A0ABT1DY20_9ACTN|nr:insulinase family protein [Actinoplanes aksuensis]MCO8275772.1 insulinase family protein [Actinoplanes aksuensis]
MIKQIEIDGVPALLAPAAGAGHAGLAFRVGFADEPLARRGITHLIEHLALFSTGVADYHYNGATGVEYTFFHMHGSADELGEFLTAVCTSLRGLPMHRLAVEKDLLRAEANGRSSGPADPMGLWRHGARDYGLPSYPEWGLPAITEDDLRDWVQRYFTRENAVLWVAGDEVPAGLRLDLPTGVRRKPPAMSSALPVTPAWFPGGSGVLVWDALVPRAPRSAVFAGVLERVMFRELRQEGGLSYAAHAAYEPVGVDHAQVTAVADALPDKQGAVLGGFVDVLAGLRVGRIDEADVAAVVKKQTEALRHADEQGARLPGQALNLLCGREVLEADEVIDGLRAVTAAEIAQVAAEAWEAGLLMTPHTRADWAGFTAAPTHSETAVAGTSYRSRDTPDEKLIVGAEGVSIVSDTNRVTVRFDDCVIMRAWPDGGRHLVGADGIVVFVEPTLYKGARDAVERLDASIPAAVRVEQPARDPGQIPQPVQPVPGTAPSASPRPWRRVIVLALVASAGLAMTSRIGYELAHDLVDVQTGLVGLAATLAVTVLCGAGAVRALRTR